MPKKIGVFIILIALFLVSGCTQKSQVFVFSGEGDNWFVEYEVIKTDVYNEKGGLIKYIGNDPMPKRIKYTIYKSQGDVPLREKGTHIILGCNGCAVPNENMEVEAIIEWEDNIEKIPLTIKKQ